MPGIIDSQGRAGVRGWAMVRLWAEKLGRTLHSSHRDQVGPLAARGYGIGLVVGFDLLDLGIQLHEEFCIWAPRRRTGEACFGRLQVPQVAGELLLKLCRR